MSNAKLIPNSIAVSVVAVVVFIYLAPWQYSPAWWGLNLLQVFGWPVRTGIALAAVFSAIGVSTLASGWNPPDRFRKVLLYGIIPGALIALFYLLRVRAHYLGDGILRAKEVEIGVWWLPTEPLAAMLNRGAYELLNSWFGLNGLDSIRVVSIISGVAFYFTLLWFVRTAFRERHTQVLMFLLLFVSGTTLLFCGYSETYMMIPALLTLFFTAGIKALRREWSFAPVSALYLLLVLFHFKSLILLPCLLVGGHYARTEKDWRGVVTTLLAVWLSLLIVWKLPSLSPLPSLGVAGLLLDFGTQKSDYALFSEQHLIDVLNQIVLTGAAAVALLFVALSSRSLGRLLQQRTLGFVVAAVPGALGMMFFLHSRLGYAVDWDLFSACGMILTFVAAMMFSEYKQFTIGRAAHAMLPAIGFITFLSFAAVNSNFDRAVNRQIAILSLYDVEGAIGFETLGNHLNAIGRTELAERMWRRSIALRPHVRSYANLAQLALNEKRITEAEYYARKGLDLDSSHGLLWSHLAQAQAARGDVGGANESFGRAIVLAPRDFSVRFNYSVTLAKAGRWADVEVQTREALRVNPTDPNIPALLGQALMRQRKYTEAEDLYRKMISAQINPDDAYLNLTRALAMQGKLPAAKGVIEEFLQKYPNSAATPTIIRAGEEIDSLMRLIR